MILFFIFAFLMVCSMINAVNMMARGDFLHSIGMVFIALVCGGLAWVVDQYHSS